MTLEELASVANFSKFHFNRIFQSIVGETPFQFISRVRIEKAAMLIATNKNESISEIAYKCGFSDTQYFREISGIILTLLPRSTERKNFKKAI